MSDYLYWARVCQDARVPQKRDEDGGWDLYACFQENYVEILPMETKLIPLGVASAFSDECVMFLKERGSSGKAGLSLRAGVIDSGYRGEYIAAVTNVNSKPLRIVKKEAVSEQPENVLLYPYEKAICQGVLLRLPKTKVQEISLEELKAIPSLRGEGKLGSSGK